MEPPQTPPDPPGPPKKTPFIPPHLRLRQKQSQVLSPASGSTAVTFSEKTDSPHTSPKEDNKDAKSTEPATEPDEVRATDGAGTVEDTGSTTGAGATAIAVVEAAIQANAAAAAIVTNHAAELRRRLQEDHGVTVSEPRLISHNRLVNYESSSSDEEMLVMPLSIRRPPPFAPTNAESSRRRNPSLTVDTTAANDPPPYAWVLNNANEARSRAPTDTSAMQQVVADAAKGFGSGPSRGSQNTGRGVHNQDRSTSSGSNQSARLGNHHQGPTVSYGGNHNARLGDRLQGPSTLSRAVQSSRKGHHAQSQPSSSRGGGSRGGGGFQGTRRRWPTAAEQRADPHRWDTTWDDEEENNKSCHSGSSTAWSMAGGVRPLVRDGGNSGLANWDGGLASPPDNWDTRSRTRAVLSPGFFQDWNEGIVFEMGGMTTHIPDREVRITSEVTIGGEELGQLAPRYWLQARIDNQTPTSFYKGLVATRKLEPEDEDDALTMAPWWENYEPDAVALQQPLAHPTVEGPSPDETDDGRLQRETDEGSQFHTANRKRLEKAKKEKDRARRQAAAEKIEKLRQSTGLTNMPEKIKPGIKLYIRGARPQDIKAIIKIYNHHVTHGVCVPEIQPLTEHDMTVRYNAIRNIKLPFLVACKRGEVIPGRRKHQDPLVLPDEVVGFVYADVYDSPTSIYRFAAEVLVCTDNQYYMKGVASCLMDKILGILDEDYVERGGYAVEGDEAQGIGHIKNVKNMIVHLSYDNLGVSKWKTNWLIDWCGFSAAGNFERIGYKDGKYISVGLFQRTTGASIENVPSPIATQQT